MEYCGNESAAKTNETYAALEAYFKLGDINAILTTENTKLQQENAVLRAALDSATHDTTFTERKVRQELAGFQLLPARVVSNGVRRGHDGYLVINRGRKDGIRPEMGVVGGGGVIGIVYLVGENYALVLPVTHHQIEAISCRVRGKNYFGYLQWGRR